MEKIKRIGLNPLRVAVVATVLNERATVRGLIRALRRQSQAPAEIVIVDGGSADGTWEILTRQQGIKAFQRAGNRSVGRNWGVEQSRSPIIAFTDAGCIPDPNWLEELVKPFGHSEVEVVSGYYRAEPRDVFEKCLVPYVLVMPDVAGRTEFYPATRSMALSRSVWDKSGGFDQRLSHNEDYAFAHKLKGLGVNFCFAPRAIVKWLPRKNLRSASWMFMRFAIGDAQAGLWRPKVKLLFLRYYLLFFSLFLLYEVSRGLVSVYLVSLLVLYSAWAIGKNYKYVQDVRALFWLPVLQLTADTMVIFGTLVGLLSR